MKLNQVVGGIVFLLVGWSIFIPVFEGADEGGHYCHAEYIARNRRLPNFNVRDGCFLAYPPVYYLTVSPLIALNPQAEFSDRQIKTNPLYLTNRKDKDVYAKYIHTRDELLFRWNPLLQAVHLVRLISVIGGTGIVVLTLKAAQKIKSLPWLPPAALILFFNPMYLHMFSVVSNLTLVSFLAAVFIYLEVVTKEGEKSKRKALFQGLVLGLGAITKINMLSLIPGYALSLLTAKKKIKSKVQEAGLVAAGFGLSAGWYIARTLKLYGEPFEVKIAGSFRGASMTKMAEMGLLNYWSSFPDTGFRTFWSGYGLVKVWLPEMVVVGLLVVSLLVGGRVLAEYRRLPRRLKLASYFLVAVFLGHLVINTQTEAFHAKDVFIAYLPLALLFGYGWRSLLELKLSRKTALVTGMAALAFYAKSEIVRLSKVLLSLAKFSGFYAPETVSLVPVLGALVAKAMVVLGLVWFFSTVVGLFGSKKEFGPRLVTFLAGFDLLVLGYTFFKLYGAFI